MFLIEILFKTNFCDNNNHQILDYSVDSERISNDIQVLLDSKSFDCIYCVPIKKLNRKTKKLLKPNIFRKSMFWNKMFNF